MSRLLKNFAKRFVHGESSSGGGGGGDVGGSRRDEGNALVPYGYEHGIEDLLEAAENVENAAYTGVGEGDGGVGDGDARVGEDRRGRGGRRGGGRSRRSRRGLGQTSTRIAELSGFVDPELNVNKALTNFRALPEGEEHVSTQSSLADMDHHAHKKPSESGSAV